MGEFDRSLGLDPDNAETLLARALAHASLERHDLAIADYTRVIDLDPGNTRVLHNRGTANMRLGRYERAIEDFDAINRYETQGLNATLAHYNRKESIEGQWYVFIIDENDLVIAHPDSGRLGLDLKGWVGIDANGYNFGPEMLSATEDGKWVSYVYQNPESGSITPGDLSKVDLKNAWVVRHDGLLFASGWYIDVDQFTRDVVSAVVDLFSSAGLEAIAESLSSNPGSILGGVAESAVSYNASGAVEGEWSIFIADSSGTIVVHFNPAMIGTRIEDLLGADTLEIDEDGTWLTSESMRIWVVSFDGWVFGAGWRSDESA